MPDPPLLQTSVNHRQHYSVILSSRKKLAFDSGYTAVTHRITEK
jgi:hypothetical protein